MERLFFLNRGCKNAFGGSSEKDLFRERKSPPFSPSFVSIVNCLHLNCCRKGKLQLFTLLQRCFLATTARYARFLCLFFTFFVVVGS